MILRAIRVLEIIGEESWVRAVLARSFVAPERPFEIAAGTITEVVRTLEVKEEV